MYLCLSFPVQLLRQVHLRLTMISRVDLRSATAQENMSQAVTRPRTFYQFSIFPIYHFYHQFHIFHCLKVPHLSSFSFFFILTISSFSIFPFFILSLQQLNIFHLINFCGKNMLDVYVIPRCMMSTRQWSRPETNVCWKLHVDTR